MLKVRKYIIAFCLLLTGIATLAQTGDKILRFNNIPASRFSGNATIYAVTQDHTGFIWLGSDYGLLRYDGHNFYSVESKDRSRSDLLNEIHVGALLLSHDTSLWVGTFDGAMRLNLITYEISRLEFTEGIEVRALYNQDDSIIWIGTSQGLYRYHLQTGHAVLLKQDNAGLSQNFIESIYADRSGNLWVGTIDQLNVLYKDEKAFFSIDLKGSYRPEIKNNLILDIQPYLPGVDSLLWIGTETGLCLFNRYSLDFTKFNKEVCNFRNEVIKTIYVLDERNLFLGTDMGLHQLDPETRTTMIYLHDPFDHHSIVNNVIWEIQSDENSNLWLATSNGLSMLKLRPEFFRYHPVYFLEYNRQIGTLVNDVCQDRENNYWIATKNGVLSLKAGTGEREVFSTSSRYPLRMNNINTIFGDSQGRIWIGSVAGVNLWDPAEKKMHRVTMVPSARLRLESNYISSFIEGHDRQFWVGTYGGGLYRVDFNSSDPAGISLSYAADFNGDIVRGREFFWTIQGNRVSRFDPLTERVVEISKISDHSGEKMITAICYASSGVVWVGANKELISYNPKQDSIWSYEMPIKDNYLVNNLIEDNEGFIWGSSSRTIFRFDPEEAVFEFFSLPSNIPLSSLVFASINKNQKGEILICGNDGFLGFDPGAAHHMERKQNVYITAIRVNDEILFPGKMINSQTIINKDIHLLPDLDLNYKNRTIGFDFSTFLYDEQNIGRFAYQLVGYDDGWKITHSEENRIGYINLPPGRYQLNVRSFLSGSDEEITRLQIRVRPPIWASPTMLVIYILILLMVIATMVYLYHNRMKYIGQMRMLKMEQEQNEMLNKSKTRFFINISHELLTPLSLIIEPIRNILSGSGLEERTRTTLTLVERNARYLKVYIDQLLNFRKIDIGALKRSDSSLELVSFCEEILDLFKEKAGMKGISLVLKSNVKELEFDTDQAKLFSILQNLISNAIKFTGQDGNVSLKIKYDSKHEVSISVKDSGIGIPEEEREKIFERFYQGKGSKSSGDGSGIGLTIVKDFVEILEGTLKLKSETGKGSTISIILPVRNSISGQEHEETVIREYVHGEKTMHRNEIGRGFSEMINEDLPVIQVVEDNIDVFHYIASTLGNKYNFRWAANGKEALKQVMAKMPSVIITDILMPEMDGIELCKKLRKDKKSSRIPIIILTAKTDQESQLEAIETGVDVFLTKPFEVDILDANISNLISRAKRTEEFVKQKLILNAGEVEVDSADEKLLKEAVKYIHDHLTNSKINAKEISYNLGVSHSNLYRKIKAMTGQSLNEFIRTVRLNRAEHLLRTGKLSVAEVMYEVGFTNHSYFSKCFRRVYKITPKEYLKKNRP